MRKYFFSTILAGFVITLAAGVFAANQIKTTETFIIGTPDVLSPSTATSSELTLYIGDNLSGVTNPVKSAQVAVSGIYTSTADGSITVQLGSDSQVFTMKDVSAPTPFEILYNATGTTDAITSAGTYNYPLTVTPSAQITIYGLSAKLAESHEYVPATCADGSPANEKVKTTETFIIGTPDVLNPSTATSSALTLYIGDSLTGVSNPVKSAQVAVSGVYTSTADGSIDVQLGSDLQTFTMKNVSAPTPFEILYNATGTTDAITSAGTYTYTLYVTPLGVTIYGLGAKLVETHRYRPPTCGTGYAATGNLESSTFDTGIVSGSAYNSIMWAGQLGTNEIGKVKLQLATDAEGDGPWTYYGADCNQGTFYTAASSTPMEIGCPAVHNNKRYFRYKVTICSANNCSDSGETTPQVDDVIVNWSP